MTIIMVIRWMGDYHGHQVEGDHYHGHQVEDDHYHGHQVDG